MHVDSIRKLFTEIRYSEAGKNARTREEAAYMHFVDYLDDCERGSSKIIQMRDMHIYMYGYYDWCGL